MKKVKCPTCGLTIEDEKTLKCPRCCTVLKTMPKCSTCKGCSLRGVCISSK